MTALLLALISVLVAADTFSLDLSLAPGLSFKNAMVYLTAGILIFRVVLGASVKFGLAELHTTFAILIGYAMFSYLATALVVDYPGYEALLSGIYLKANLVDHLIFFLVFFYGTRSSEDAVRLTKALVLAVCLASCVTLLDVTGLLNLGVTEVGTSGEEEGRVYGVFGHANETAALIAGLIPAMLATVISSRAMTRALWMGAALASIVVFILTGSRGGIVGLILGGAWATYICRKYVSPQAAIRWAVIGFLLLIPVIAVLSIENIDLLKRLIGVGRSTDVGEMSSGRTVMWGEILTTMMSKPLTLITGFGWNAYSIMPFRYLPHNHYLGVLFDLGLIGIVCLFVIMRQSIAAALKAIAVANDTHGRFLIALIFGVLAFTTAIFFANVFKPWIYFWAYVGISMRLAVNVLAAARDKEKEAKASKLQGRQRFTIGRELPLGAAGGSRFKRVQNANK